MSDWKCYLGDRLKLDHPKGFVIIIPAATNEVIPPACPVCDMLMHSSDDAEYFRHKKCCSKCGMKWADSNLEKWNEGWRPDDDEIKKEISLRREVPVSLGLNLPSR